MNPQETIDRLRLARTESIGPVAYRRLIARYGNAAAALEALPDLARAGGRSIPLAIPKAAEVERELEANARYGARLLFSGTEAYPPLLDLLTDPPPVLFMMGDERHLARRAVAIVGSRNASANGRRFTENLARDLAEAGFAVVSGLARGIDGAAHLGALGVGSTIACIAGGLDRPYPAEHAKLMARIAEEGAVLAEMPFGTIPLARHFPRRNRIIAGLALGVVVVEAALRSGSLITARLALEAGRDVFAVPGSPLDERCAGTNGLLRQGAHLTTCAADVTDNLPDHPLRDGLGRDPLFNRGEAFPGLAEPEAEILTLGADERSEVVALLGPSPTDVDDLIRRCQFSAPTIMAVLLELEVAGRVETYPGNRVALLEPRIAEPVG